MPDRTADPQQPLVRPIQPAGHEAVGRLLVSAYQPGGRPPDDHYHAELADIATRAGQADVLVAELAGRVVGTATVCLAGSPLREVAEPGEAELRMVAVDPGMQGRGIGRVLLHASEDLARRSGCRAMALSSAEWMRAAHRLCESAGFQRTPERDWTPVPDVPLHTYRREL